MTARYAHDLPYGAQYLGHGRSRFRLWAPGQEQVSLQIEGGGREPMRRGADGWFELESAASPGARYRYVLGDGQAVPDPASRFQPEDVHGPSLVIDPRAYEWRCSEWRGRPWTDTVIYELHVGACGGFRGVRERLPQLAELGVTAVELMPIADFPGRRNWGYDGVLPYAPDSAYGSVDALKALIDEAHALGLMVYLDVVYNHFGPDGNYLHAYAPAFFRKDRQTPWGDAIDFRRGEVRQFFIQNALYWLREYRIDGLRFDAVHAIADGGFLDEMARTIRQCIAADDPQRHVHLMLENERNEAHHLEQGYDAQWNDDAHNALHVLLTGEHEGYYGNYVDGPARHFARCLGEGFAYQGEPSPGHDGEPRGTPSGHVRPTAFIFFLQNHDQVGNRAFGERLTVLADPAALRAAAAVQLLCPHTPLLFMGEEWGSRAPFLFFTDYQGELAEAVRKGRRQEFAKFSAFADASKRQRIPDPNDEETFRRSQLPADEPARAVHAQWLADYRRLLQLRRDVLAPRLDGARSLGAEPVGTTAVVARWRLGDGSLLRIAANFGAEAVAVEPLCAAPLYATGATIDVAVAEGRLPGRSAIVWLETAT